MNGKNIKNTSLGWRCKKTKGDDGEAIMKKAKIGINLFILCQEGVEDDVGRESPLIAKMGPLLMGN